MFPVYLVSSAHLNTIYSMFCMIKDITDFYSFAIFNPPRHVKPHVGETWKWKLEIGRFFMYYTVQWWDSTKPRMESISILLPIFYQNMKLISLNL